MDFSNLAYDTKGLLPPDVPYAKLDYNHIHILQSQVNGINLLKVKNRF